MIKLSKLVSELYTFGDRDKPPYSRFDTAREQEIKEVGDSSAKTYPYHRMGKMNSLGPSIIIGYEFDAEAGEYEIDIEKIDLDDGTLKYDVGFGVKDPNRPSGVDFKQETNKGELFKVMATVVKAIKAEIELDESNEYYVTKISFSPTKADVKDDAGITVTDFSDRRREKLYLAYVKNQFPNATVKSDDYGAEIEVTLNKRDYKEDVEQHGAFFKFSPNKK